MESRALLATVEFQNFDGVKEPALPAGWVTAGTGPIWRTLTGTTDTAPNNAFVADGGFVSASVLTSPAFIAPPNAQIQFRNLMNTLGGNDGGVFEISVNGGAFVDVTFVGGSFATGGYNGGLTSGSGNPLGGRLAWTGTFAGYIDTTVNLHAAAFGQSVQVRWLMGTGGNSPAFGGWLIDTVRLVSSANFADYGDAPSPYPTTVGENGAAHLAGGPRLGASRDVEATGTHSASANSDGADENGVTFGAIRVGDLGATATVNVAGAPSGAKLSAWIDFNGDGNWGGPDEQIAANLAVVNGNNTIKFDVPSIAEDGQTFARFRLSTAGNLGPDRLAMDGEVEDYAVTILRPTIASGAFGSQNIISTGANGASSVFAADMDGDGDLDVLSASSYDDKIAWYENIGSEVFLARTISTAADRAISVFAADMDGDGDLDVLSASLDDNKIAWYEKKPGNVFTVHTISTAATGAVSVFGADVDGDGDMDVLSASTYDSKIAWYENNGSEVFTAHTISLTADGPLSVTAADVDGDGDLDVLSASRNDHKIAWYENNGNEVFTPHTISAVAVGAQSVFVADVDGDGDLDVLSASSFFNDDKIAWYENDGSPAVGAWEAHTISTTAVGATSVTAADVDGDGDLDVLSASQSDAKIAWYENDGTPAVGSWTAHTISTTAAGARSVFAADMDGDGDLDVLSASLNDDKIAWYKNGSSANAAPVISAFDTPIAYTENGAALVLDTNVVVTDADSANLATGKLTVQLISNGQSTDRVEIRNQGVASGQIGVNGDNVTFGGVVIGTFTGGTGTTALVVTFNTNATPARVQALLRNVTYRSLTENPVTIARVVRVTLTDGDGGTSNLPTKSINVTAVNDAPVITAFDTSITYTENGAALLIDANAIVTDVDSANLALGKLTVQLINNGQSADRVEIRNQGVAAGLIGVSGANVTFGGVVIGTFTGGIGTTALVVTFNTNATPSRVLALLRNVTYRSTSQNPSTTARVVRVTLTDGDGGTSNLPTKTINVIAVNDAPVISGFDAPITYTAGGAGLVLDANAGVTDTDSVNMATGTLTVQLISNGQSTDRLAIRHQGVAAGQIGVNGVNVTFGGVAIGTFTGGTGTTALVVTFNTSATPTIVQSLLRNVTYRNTSATPSTLARMVRVKLTDGDGGTSNLPTKLINVVQ